MENSEIIFGDNYLRIAFENSEEIVFKNRDVRKAVAKLVTEVHTTKECPESQCTEGSDQTVCRSTQSCVFFHAFLHKIH